MNDKYKLLDLFCGAGGAGMGYFKAGFEVTGIDIEPQEDYPFKFICADAFEYLNKFGSHYDAIHASPLCQFATRSTASHRLKGKEYINLIPRTRDELSKFDIPIIIENVPEAGLRPDIVLQGNMFNLKVIRKRVFELHNWFCLTHEIPKLKGTVADGNYVSIFGKASWKRSSSGKNKRTTIPVWRKKTIKETWGFAMGIDWMKKDTSISQAIPPAYTEYIGHKLIDYLNSQKFNELF